MKKFKVNAFDIVVLVALLAVVFTVYSKFTAFKGEEIGRGEASTQKVELELWIEGVRPVTVDAYAVGDQLYQVETRRPLGKIQSMEVIPHTKSIETADGRSVLAEVEGRQTIVMVLETDAILTERGYIMAGVDMKIGKQFLVENRLSQSMATVFGITVKE